MALLKHPKVEALENSLQAQLQARPEREGAVLLCSL